MLQRAIINMFGTNENILSLSKGREDMKNQMETLVLKK